MVNIIGIVRWNFLGNYLVDQTINVLPDFLFHMRKVQENAHSFYKAKKIILILILGHMYLSLNISS